MQKRWVSTGTVFLFALLACAWATAVQASEEAAPKAAFVESSWRFDSVFEGQEIMHDFVVKNQGTAPLEIIKVQTSWGCTAVSFTRLIPPGEEGTIKIKVNTEGFGGRTLDKTATVLTNDPNQNSVKLTVTGQVERFADITPDKVSLQGETGDQIQATVTIVPKAKQPFKIVSSRAKDGQNIRFELKEDTSGGSSGYRLTVTNLKSEPARYRDTIYLDTDNEVNPVIKIKVYGAIDKPRAASVTPEQLIIRGRSGEKLQVSARIVPKDGRELKITEAKADKGEDISFKLSEAKEGDTTVYTVTAENQKVVRGLYRDVIRLQTSSEIQPEIEIPVMVFIN